MLKHLIWPILICLLTAPVIADIRVTTQTLKNLAIYPTIKLPASVVSMNDSKLSAEVRAVVKDIPVLVGETITRGETLIELDNRDHKLNLRRTEVNLTGAKLRLKHAVYQLKQARTLFKQKAISDELLQQRQADVNTLTAEHEAQKVSVAIAKRNMEKCLVTAPFDAIVAERLTQVGELASIGTPLVRVIDASRIEVSVKVQPQDVSSLLANRDFTFISQNIKYPVILREITPVIDLIQRNQEARFQFSQNRALPGTSGILSWKKPLPHIPSNLILRRNKKYGVFINEKNTAKFIVLKNASEGKPSVINLPINTSIIVDGRYRLQNGDAITIEK